MASGKSIIEDITSKLSKYYQSGDMKSISEFYTEDCRIMAPGMETQGGRKAVEETMGALRAKGIANFDIKNEEIVVDGDYGYDVGRYKMLAEDGSTIGTGKSVIILKKVNGVFQIHVDIFNDN
ncbi:uncharacterized protein [Ptychodera flava]|uniref:uncharacterized protein n=1 Tax=Ptychodera flava TaxID=63121 RepID=UPI00396A7318